MEVYNQLTIIICLYNAEEYIDNVVNNIFEAPPKSEIIIVEEYSENQVIPEIILRTKSKRKVITYQKSIHENKGVSFSRNIALSLSTKMYVLNIDQDDSVIFNSQSLSNNADVLAFKVNILRDGKLYKEKIRWRSAKYWKLKMLLFAPPRIGAVIISKDLILRAGGFKENMKGGEEWLLFWEMFSEQFNLSFSDDLTVIRRVHGSNESLVNRNNRLTSLYRVVKKNTSTIEYIGYRILKYIKYGW